MAAALAAPPAPLLTAERMGIQVPAARADVPSIVMALALDAGADGSQGYSLGRITRPGTPVRPDLPAEPVRAERYAGLIILEVWADNGADAAHLARGLTGRLQRNVALLRSHGFLALRPASLDPLQAVLHTPPSGAPFAVWRQKMAYRFVFELEELPVESEGGPIVRIDVDLGPRPAGGLPAESFSVPRGK